MQMVKLIWRMSMELTLINLLSYNRIIRQRQGNGETFFEYEDIIENFDFSYEVHQQPVHQTIVNGRDGYPVRYLFNVFGNMIYMERYARVNGFPKVISKHYRYNKDGNLINWNYESSWGDYSVYVWA